MYGSIKMAKSELEEKVADAAKIVKADIRELDIKFDAHEKLDAERFEQVKLNIMKIEMREQSRGEMFGPARI